MNDLSWQDDAIAIEREVQYKMTSCESFSDIVHVKMRAQSTNYDGVNGTIIRHSANEWSLHAVLRDHGEVTLKSNGLSSLILMWVQVSMPAERLFPIPPAKAVKNAVRQAVPEVIVPRIGDQERMDCVDNLSAHYQAGRIRLDEFDTRSTAALAATTQQELDNLLLDMPAVPAPAPKAITSVTVYERNPVNVLTLTGFLILLTIIFASAVAGAIGA